ncbi:MAG: PqqD family protein [Clostridia bacterium]|nr:PqqD family protein [Clostridia bacterium]
MKIKKGFKLKTVSDRQTIVADRRIHKNFNSVIILNEIAVFLWQLVAEREVSQREMSEFLEREFKMSRLSALSNTNVFIKTMKENGIIEDE